MDISLRRVIMLIDLGKSRSEDIAFPEDGGNYFMGSLFKVDVNSA